MLSKTGLQKNDKLKISLPAVWTLVISKQERTQVFLFKQERNPRSWVFHPPNALISVKGLHRACNRFLHPHLTET